MKVDLLEAPQAELLGEDTEQGLGRLTVALALTEHDHVVDLESATVRVTRWGQLELIRAFCYKVIVQDQFHLDAVVSVFSCRATD